jgi:hypothetical protein
LGGAFGTTICLLSLGVFSGLSLASDWLGIVELVGRGPLTVGLAAPPIGLEVGIVKYHHYDVDRVAGRGSRAIGGA